MKQSTLKHPLRGVTPHYKNANDVIENQLKTSRLSNSKFVYGKQDEMENAFGDEVEIIMNAGDVLYFPAGMWHKVETLEYGVSINVSLMGSNFASVVCGAIEHLLLKKDEWREVVCNRNTVSSENISAIKNRISSNTMSEGHVVVEKLDKLLGELPDIIRDFKNNGGAEFILPPVLRRAPNYVLANEDGENEEDGDNLVDEKDEDDDRMGQNVEDENEDNQQEGDEYDEEEAIDDVEDDDDQMIDLKTFQCPDDCNYRRPSPDHKLEKNPLALIMKMTDITSFDSTNNRDDNNENQYIMNLSYVGNEQHESSVRVLLRDDTGILESLCKLEQSKADQISYEDVLSIECPLDALFHYGYFIWRRSA